MRSPVANSTCNVLWFNETIILSPDCDSFFATAKWEKQTRLRLFFLESKKNHSMTFKFYT